jgi:hypothetical protein
MLKKIEYARSPPQWDVSHDARSVYEFEPKAPSGKIWGVSATTPVSALDGDLDCDHLANPDLEGHTIKEGPPSVRARAALERGLRVWFYGGALLSCLLR